LCSKDEPTASIESASTVIAIRRGPTRSTSGPPNAFSSTIGVISAKATSPVWVAEPVVVSTSHGIAIIETRVPSSEIASAVSQP
jgi:hypothetical protein